MRRAGQYRRHRQRGVAAVEFALVLPLLILLVLGTIDWGYYFFVEQIVVNAAREGARAGSLQSDDTQTALGDAETVARNYLSKLPNQAGATVSASLSSSGDAVTVSIDYPTGSLTGFMKIIVPTGARATAEMRRWNAGGSP